MSFERNRELMKLVHINVRGEKHGDEDETAVDLSFRANLPNDVLSEFSPTLKSSLYAKPDSPQQEIPDPNHLTEVKNPQLGSLKWDLKYDFARVVVHHGIDGSNDLIFGLARIKKFVITPKQGGTCEIQFQVQVHPEPKQSGVLLEILNQEVYVTIDPEGGEEEEDPQADFGEGANEIAKQIAAQKGPVARRGSRKQMALVE